MERDLLQVPVFAGLSNESLQLLAEEATLSELETGLEIVREGEPGHSMFIIRTGRVEVVKHLGEDGQTDLAELRDGDFFGEMCIVEPMPRAATVRTLEPTTLVELSSNSFQHLYGRSVEDFNILILNIARDLARRLRHLDEVFAARAH